VPAEAVAMEAVALLQEYQSADAPVGDYLADQLLLPLALAGQGLFRTRRVTSHAATNMEIIRAFLDVKIESDLEADGCYQVRIGRP
jgi:RNA 3'-terminal phosphate cyclase (ATP)